MTTIYRFPGPGASGDFSNTGWTFGGTSAKSYVSDSISDEGLNGPSGSVNSAIDNDNDIISYISSDGSVGHTAKVSYGLFPAEIGTVTGVKVQVVQSSADVKNGTGFVRLRWYKSDGTTALTNEVTTTANGIPFYKSEHTFTITGGTTRNDWNGAVLQITSDGTADEDPATINVGWLRAEITYTANSVNVTPAYPAAGQNLVGHWLADGLDVRDHSFNQNHGSLVGDLPVVGSRFGFVYDFSQVDHRVSIPAHPSLLPMGDSGNIKWSCGCWIKSSTVNNLRLFSMMGDVGERSWYFLFLADGKLAFSLWDSHLNGSVNWRTNADMTSKICDGEWHHVCCSYNGGVGASATTLIVDGEEQTPWGSNPGVTNIPFEKVRPNDHPLDLGANDTINGYTGSSPGPAGMWDCRIYNTCLHYYEWDDIRRQTISGPNPSFDHWAVSQTPRIWVVPTFDAFFESAASGDTDQSLFPGKTAEGGIYVSDPTDIDDAPEGTVLGNDTGSTSSADALTASELRTLLNDPVEQVVPNVLAYGYTEIDAPDGEVSVFSVNMLGSKTLSDVQPGDIIKYVVAGHISPNATSDDFMIRFWYDGYNVSQVYWGDTVLGSKPFLLQVELLIQDLGTQSNDGVLTRSYLHQYKDSSGNPQEVWWTNSDSPQYNFSATPLVDITAEVVSGTVSSDIIIDSAHITQHRAFSE